MYRGPNGVAHSLRHRSMANIIELLSDSNIIPYEGPHGVLLV